MNKATKEKILKNLIKGGCNEESSRKLIEKHSEYVERIYKESTPREKGSIIMTLA